MEEDVKSSQVKETTGEITEPGESTPVSEESSSSQEVTETTETTPKEEATSEPKKRYVPLEELQRERKRRRAIEERMDDLERRLEDSPKTDPVKEIQEDLNVDEETAKKLHKHGLGKKTETPKKNKLETLQESFVKRATDFAADHDDWDEYKDDMGKLLEDAYNDDPFSAFQNSPETYYLKAKLERERKSKQSSVKEAIDKSNSKNLASVESGGSSGSKPSAKPKKGSLAWLRELTPDQYKEHKAYIDAELLRGGFKE